MESKTNYTLVGIFVLVLGSATILTSLWLSVGYHSKVYHDYAIYMNEAVSGLSDQAPVKYNGVQVGYVKSISIDKEDPQQVLVIVEIEAGTPITTSTTATLMSQGITGITYVGLKAGNKLTHPLKKEPGEPYPVIPSRPSLLLQLDTAAKEISENFKKVADSIQQFIDKDNALAVKNSLRNIEEVTSMFAKESKNMQDILQKTNIAMTHVTETSREFADTMRIGKTTLKIINSQALPSTITLINKMDKIASNIDQITKEFKHNPSILLRGRRVRLGPGER